MKFFLVLLAVVAFVGCALSWRCTDEDWAKYKSTFHKTYENSTEDRRHHDIYCDTLKLVEEHNLRYEKGESSYSMGINEYSDMSDKDMGRMLGFKNNTRVPNEIN